MKVLEYRSELHWLQAQCHMIITRDIPDKNYQMLVAAGLIDVDSGVRGVAARALKGEWLRLLPDVDAWSDKGELIKADKYNYRQINKSLGKVTHTILLHKSAVDEQLQPDQPRILIMPGGGDLALLFTKRFASDYNLPYLPQWKDALWETCFQRDYVEPLSVWTDPNVEAWMDVQAFQISSELTEDVAKGIVSELLKNGSIVLPDGVTEAPRLSDVLNAPSDSGELQEPDGDGEEVGSKVIDYLQIYAPHLAATIEEMALPAHDLDRPIHPAIAQMKRVPFPAQSHTIQAVVNGLKEQKGVIIAADMGTGKTISAIGTINTLSSMSGKNNFTCMALVPGITIPKWADELRKTLHNVKITVFRNWRDIVKWRNDRKAGHNLYQGIEVMLLSRDTAKLGMPQAPALIYKARHVIADRTGLDASMKPVLTRTSSGLFYQSGTADRAKRVRILEDVWICPECNGVQVKTDEQSIKEAKESTDDQFELMCELKVGFDDLATFEQEYKTYRINNQPTMRTQYTFRDSHDYHCTACGANLMRSVDPAKEHVSGLKKRRLQPSWFIQKYLKGMISLLIVDELHQYKTQSGNGIAMGQIVNAADKVLSLTGTLSDGKASSLYYLLWRIAPGEMLADGIDHRSLSKFVHLYGALETKGRYTKDQTRSGGSITTTKLVMNPPKERPGLSPKLFTNHLSNRAVFLELGDLGLPLVELDEQPVFVQMEPDHAMAYAHFHNELEQHMKVAYMLGNKNAFAPFIPAVVNAANQPHVEQAVPIGEDEVVYFDPPQGPESLSAKEERLLEDIRAELKQQRRVVVYVRYSGKAGQDQRIYDVLTRHSIRARVMKSSVSPEDRVQWLEKAVEDDIDVVICNAKLVEVGLDLLEFPSLFFLQFTDEVNIMRQASRRSWRIGQHRTAKIRYYVYENTYELVQFKRMMAKRSHAMLLEGRIQGGDLAKYVEQDSQSASTFSIAACLGDVQDLSQKWKELADSDIPAGVMMLEESKFKDEIGLAMQRLASETRRLAGVPKPINIDAVERVTSPIGELVSGEASQLSLFDAPVESTSTVSASMVDTSKDKSQLSTVESTPLTVGEMRAKMGLVVKAKKRDKISDDQVMLFAI